MHIVTDNPIVIEGLIEDQNSFERFNGTWEMKTSNSYIKNDILYFCSPKDKYLVIPDGVKSINALAFKSFSNFKDYTIEFPDSIENIDSYAFFDGWDFNDRYVGLTVKTNNEYVKRWFSNEKVNQAKIESK